jgi:methylase of polypeptide subunit release factors
VRDDGPMDAPVTPLLDEAGVGDLRTALADYTVDSVQGLLGLAGQSAHRRGDLAGVARVLRTASGDGATARRTADLIRLFLLGRDVDEAAARAALHPLPLDRAESAGLLETSAGSVRARLEIRPYAEDIPELPTPTPTPGPPWWVVSDLGSDVRTGPLAPDHVLGIGGASLTLAQATPRTHVGSALDIGTGCGVQSLHLAGHAGQVTATDVSRRALRLAATTAALSGQNWDLRAGSLLDPVDGERFDLVVANPPFVVSAGVGGYDYRDSGLAGDGVSEHLVANLGRVLAPGGTAVLLANWIIDGDESGADRVERWLAGRRCDAWVWQREVAEPGEYVAMWLRDAGESPGTERWNRLYDEWLDWFAAAGVAAIGMGLVALWASEAETPIVVVEDVPQAVEQPIGGELPAWIQRRRGLAALSDADLLECRLAAADDLVRTSDDLLDPLTGWTTATGRLRQSHGMRWSVEVDSAVAAVVAGCDGRTPLRVPCSVLAASLDRGTSEVAEALLPVVRDLVSRGILLLEPPA